jgi:aspartyl-tRNA(Asn)/glutamyl-tRNA(Gln) amidotransferase subunit A
MADASRTARATAAAVRRGAVSALALAEQAIAAIETRDGAFRSVTRLLGERALADARRMDAEIAAGRDPGPLAGVPFGVKDLFDVAGLPNTAGSAMRRSAPAAGRDAEAVRRMAAAGAVLVATLNMDEFAYGFATINAHHGTTRNPHDVARLAGGSSGGSAAAVAAGLLPLTLGSDTNGSIRIPAALCGVYGLKPTHGALPMAGVAPFVDSFDDIGPFAATLDDLLLAYEVLLGARVEVGDGKGLRVGRLGGWFARNVSTEMADGLEDVARAFGAADVELPQVAAARSAAYLMTAAEGGALHLPDLRCQPLAFDPATRDRLIAGAMLPTSAYWEAERFRAWFRAQAASLFDRFDVLLAPATGAAAPLIDDPFIDVDGARQPARSHLGLFTQPLSFIGLPVIAAPLARPGKLPLGLQLIAAPGGEAILFALAQWLEREGLIGACPLPRNVVS